MNKKKDETMQTPVIEKPDDSVVETDKLKPSKGGAIRRFIKSKVGDSGDDFKKRLKFFVIVYSAICLTLLCIAGARDIATINRIEPHYESTSSFSKAVEDGRIFSAYLSQDESQIMYQYVEDVPDELLEEDPSKIEIMKFNVDTWHYANYTSFDDLKSKLYDNGIVLIKGKFDSALDATFSMIISLSTTVVMIYFMYMMISMLVKNMTINAKKYEVNNKTGVKFSDVIGHDEVIGDIKQYMVLLRDNKKLKNIHVKVPKGILFTGRPGTGKTLLAKAMAGEGSLPFIYLNTSNVIELYVGVGAKTIRECFKKARELAPCVVFLDEIDAIGGGRGKTKVGSSEDTQTLLALLQEMDGFSGSEGVLVIAATNCPESLDEALMRSGRFDREIIIRAPRNAKVRLQLLEHYTKHYKLAPDVNLEEFAKTLADMTGADIANICNEAAVINIMENNGELSTIHMQNLVDAYDKLLLKGNKLNDKSRVNQADRKIVAYHEAGHAVMNFLQHEPISRISIQGTTSGVGGFVMGADNDSQFRSVQDLYNNVRTKYGGRASEIIKFGKDHATTGAVNDIETATNVLQTMFLRYGFDDDLGMLDYQQLLKLDLVDKAAVCERVKKKAAALMEETLGMLGPNYYLVEALAEKMLEEEVMTGEEATVFLASERSKHSAKLAGQGKGEA